MEKLDILPLKHLLDLESQRMKARGAHRSARMEALGYLAFLAAMEDSEMPEPAQEEEVLELSIAI